MRNILLLFTLLVLTSSARGDLIFQENAGSPTGTTAYNSNVWQNSTLSFTGTGEVRITSPSSGYAGSSGGGNVFLTAGGTTSLIIGNINTTGYTPGTFDLSFGAFKSATASNMTELQLSYSADGISFTNIAIPAQATGSGTADWRPILFSNLSLPTVSNLRLRWINTAATGVQFRLDDFKLEATITAVPEPSSIGLLGIAYCSFIFRRRRN